MNSQKPNWDFELGDFQINFNPSQLEFFQKFHNEASRYVGFGGGFGNGKTLAGCIAIAELAARYPGNLLLVGRLKGTDLEASTKKTMMELIAPWLDSGWAEHKVKDNKIVLGNKSEIVFRHLEDVYASGILGMNLGGFYIDQAEEVAENAFDTLTSRLRRKSFAPEGEEAPRMGILTFNMAGHNWIWRLFKKKWGKDKEPLENPADFDLVEASTLDNKDHLPEDYIKDLLSKDKEWVKRYVYGSWDVFGGQVFDEFNQELHVIPHREPAHSSVRFIGIDPGHVDPFAVIWLAIEPGGQRYVYAEHYVSGKPTKWHADIIKAKSAGQHIMARFVDAANAQVIADLNDEGIYCIAAKKETLQSRADVYAGGINQLKDLFKINNITKQPGLVISDNCQSLIYELQQYAWKQRKGDMNAPEVPEDRNNHAIDALRYIILNYFETPKGGKDRVIMR
jgi:phage terminase large subunit